MKIVFMGTADFGLPTLDTLVKEGYEIAGVVTATDKKSGRGQKVSMSPIKEYALEKNLPLLQPSNLKAPEFLEELKAINADLFVVVAFRMLPESVWSLPSKGTLNLHSSLLPQYRGAAPINWAIINGETKSGVSTFFIEKEIDTGDIIYQAETPIDPNENAGSLHDRLMEIGAGLVSKTVKGIIEGNNPRIRQNHDQELKHAPKIFKDDCLVNWNQPLQKVHDFVRGMSPYPVAWSNLGEKSFRISQAKMSDLEFKGEMPGTLILEGKKNLLVACADGYLSLEQVQLQGKKRMAVADFRNGTQLEEGVMLV